MDLKKVLKKYNKKFFDKAEYLKVLEKATLEEENILLEAQHGNNVNGNIFYILKELLENPAYQNYRVFLSLSRNHEDKNRQILEQYGLEPQIVIVGELEYYHMISSANYLFTDTSFLPFFIKKNGQKIINVWHGTPLKILGKGDNSGFHSLGNVQKNFVIADYLLYPNQYMKDHMIEGYMLENLYKGECILNGYPRNEVFFQDKNQKLIEQLKLEEKEIIGYMPTWRGGIGHVDNQRQIVHLTHYLLLLDKQLKDDQVVLVNLHPLVSNAIDMKLFKKIRSFPSQYETYEVLNLCDKLITDYSSVFFDYAVTRRKVILFTYDMEEYLADRGLYFSMEELPFPIVETVEDLVREINSDTQYDDTEFIQRFAAKENPKATNQLLEYVLHGQGDMEVQTVEGNGKDNVLIYSGNLAKNGITTALLNLLKNIDLERYNYYVTFTSTRVKAYRDTIRLLPEGVSYLPVSGIMNASLLEKLYIRYMRKSNHSMNHNNKVLDRLYQYEIKRCYGDIKFKHVVQYSGYEAKRQLLFGRFDCNKVIFVHSNMVEEVRVRGSQDPNNITYCYNNYDKVVMVTEDMRQPTLAYCKDESKITVARNIIDYQYVEYSGDLDPTFDTDTSSTHKYDEIMAVLDDPECIAYVNVARYSPEKGQSRLMKAFDKLYAENNQLHLVIIGGHGAEYKKLLGEREELASRDHIIFIRSLSNPFPFIKRCDYFVLSSFYEGFGLVLAEANILGLPIMSTDILGPKGFMEHYGGLLVESSEEGIYQGMREMMLGNVKAIDIDYEAYNREASEEFEVLLPEK